jgi:hypothetical protein
MHGSLASEAARRSKEDTVLKLGSSGWLSRSVLVASIAAVLLVPSEAAAAPIRECNMSWDGTRWFYGSDQSRVRGYSAHNFTTRVATCRTARKVFRAKRRIRANSEREYWRKAKHLRAAGRRWRCYQVASGHEWSDVRCKARGGCVVRWQEGS